MEPLAVVTRKGDRFLGTAIFYDEKNARHVQHCRHSHKTRSDALACAEKLLGLVLKQKASGETRPGEKGN